MDRRPEGMTCRPSKSGSPSDSSKSKMNIALSTLSGVSYGGLTYFNNLLPALAEVDTTNNYHIYVAKKSPIASLVRQDNFIFHECLTENNSSLQRFVWEQCVLPRILRRDKIEVMFTAKNLDIFAAPCKTVIAIRNVEPLFYTRHKNHWRLNIASWFRRALTRLSIGTSDRIVAVSESAKNDVASFSQKAKGRISVVHNGNSIKERPQSFGSSNVAEDFILTSSKFVAYANQSSLIEAYALLTRRKPDVPPLCIAGGVLDKDYFSHVKRQIRANGLTDAVKILGLVPHEQLMDLCSRAMVFLFPSTLEACPQTLIEAMACGAPIAASNVPPMPEICDNAAMYFDPFDPNDIADKIDHLISDGSLRNKLKHESLMRAEHFCWRRAARKMVQVFQEVGNSDLEPSQA